MADKLTDYHLEMQINYYIYNHGGPLPEVILDLSKHVAEIASRVGFIDDSRKEIEMMRLVVCHTILKRGWVSFDYLPCGVEKTREFFITAWTNGVFRELIDRPKDVEKLLTDENGHDIEECVAESDIAIMTELLTLSVEISFKEYKTLLTHDTSAKFNI